MIINRYRFLIIKAVLITTIPAILVFSVFAASLPGEYLVTQNWRSINNQYSPLINPANIAEDNYLSVRAMVAPVGAFTLSEIGVNYPVSLYHTASFATLIEGAGAVYEDAFDESTGKLGTNTESALSNTNLIFSLGYAWHVWQRLIVGANINFAYQSNFGDALMGMGIDLGAAYHLYKHPVWGEHIVGVAAQNLIAGATPELSFSEYPFGLRFSDNSTFWKKRIYYGADVVLRNVFAKAENFQASGSGLQDVYTPVEWEINQKVGVNIWRIFKLYGLLGLNDAEIGRYGFALGAKLGFHSFRSIEAMVQFISIISLSNGTEEANASQITFYARTEFGRHREEAYISK